MRVLLVEDDADLRAVLSESLTEDGVKTFAVSNGRDALDVLELISPDVIVLDLLMDDMDGWAFRRAQKRRATVAKIPVVIVTGLQGAKVDALDADAVLLKPFTLETLTGAVRDAAHRHETEPDPPLAA